MEVCGQLHVPAALPPGKITPAGCWMGTGPGLDAVAKRKKSLPCLCQESNPGRPARSLVTMMTDIR
jgi:hypothetical protein